MRLVLLLNNTQLMYYFKYFCMYNKNDKYLVLGFRDDILQSYKSKIMSMGVIPGEIIKVKYVSLLKDPVTIEFSCGLISIRKKDLNYLELKKI